MNLKMNDEEQKDLFITSELKKFNKVPDNVNDLFNNSIKCITKKEGNNMNNKIQENNSVSNTKDTNINTNDTNNSKKIKKFTFTKKFLGFAACFVILLGGGNIYATSKGYENVFFMIKEWVAPGTSTDKADDILSNRDITISYKPIQITDDIQVVVKKLQTTDNGAKLILNIIENETQNSSKTSTPLNYEILNKNNEQVCKQKSSKENNMEKEYTEELSINTNSLDKLETLILDIYDSNYKLITPITIDLKNRTIEVAGEQEALKKISETELKEFLNYEAGIGVTDETNYLETDRIDRQIAVITSLLSANEKLPDYSNVKTEKYFIIEEKLLDDVAKSVFNIEIAKSKLNKNSLYTSFDYKGTKYFGQKDGNDILFVGNCINVSNISFCGGVYTVTYSYGFFDDGIDGFDIDGVTIYQNTVRFRYDESNKYSKFVIVSREKPTIIEDGINNTDQNTSEENSNKNDIKMTRRPSGFAGSSTFEVVLYNNGDVYVVSYDSAIDIGGHEINRKKVARNVEKLKKKEAGNIVLCGDKVELIDSSYAWVSKENEEINIDNFVSAPKPQENSSNNNENINPSSVNNYASTMAWTDYWAPGLKFKYPTIFKLEEKGGYYRGNSMGDLSTTISGVAIGKDPDTQEIIKSDLTINIYEPITISEDEANNIKNGHYGGFTTSDGLHWYLLNSDNNEIEKYVTIFDSLAADGTTDYWITKIEFETSNRNNYKVTNIINWMLGSTRITSY